MLVGDYVLFVFLDVCASAMGEIVAEERQELVVESLCDVYVAYGDLDMVDDGLHHDRKLAREFSISLHGASW